MFMFIVSPIFFTDVDICNYNEHSRPPPRFLMGGGWVIKLLNEWEYYEKLYSIIYNCFADFRFRCICRNKSLGKRLNGY